MLVRQLGAGDFDAVLRINRQGSPNVARFDEAELRRLVALADVAWVAEDGPRVAGYLLAMSNSARYDGEEFQFFRTHLDQPFLYVDQAAVDPEARRARVASQMYELLVRWGQERNIDVLCCEVNMEPENPVSMRFHAQAGFGKLRELATSDGRLVALLCRHVTPRTDWPGHAIGLRVP
jgi:predicted GNAT superfamily acetyltransferase